MKKENKGTAEKIITVPTIITILRIILTFVVIYMIITDAGVISIVIVFSIAAFSDWLDGTIARKFNMTSEFGAKADMLADRFLWMGTALAFLFIWGIRGQLEIIQGVQLLLIMSREIITAPIAIIAFFSKGLFPKVRYQGKVTTFIQGFALPALILSVIYPSWIYLSLPLSMLLGIMGIISAIHYMKDVQKMLEEKNERTWRGQNKNWES